VTPRELAAEWTRRTGCAALPASGKAPAGGRAYSDASRDPDTFDWEAAEVDGCAVVPGTGGCLVLDVDQADALAPLEAEHGPIPRQGELPSPRGCHIWLRKPDPSTEIGSRDLAPGVNVRGDRGMVIVRDVPPDVIPLAPGWVIERVTAQHYPEADYPEAEACCAPREEWTPAVVAALERYRPEAGHHPTALEAVDTLARLEQVGHRGATSAIEQLERRYLADKPERRGDWVRMLRDARHLVARTESVILAQREEGERFMAELERRFGSGGGRAPAPGYGAIDWPTFWRGRGDAGSYLVEPIIATGRGHAIHSPAKAGKSYVTLYLVAALASGRAALGKPEGAGVDVLYLDYEMTEEDLRDFLEDFGYGPEADLSRLHYVQMPSLAPLDTPEGGAELVEMVEHFGAELVVIDTLARVVEGEENSADTFRAFYRHTGQALKKRGVAYVRLDHTGKDQTRGPRGSSAKVDDVDVVWSSKRTDDGQVYRATHRRMMWLPYEVHLVKRDTAEGVRFEQAPESWPDGTQALARQLAEQGIAVEAGRPAARRALKAAGQPFRTDVLAAAIRFRKRSGALVEDRP
jgi:hypothetical protein